MTAKQERRNILFGSKNQCEGEERRSGNVTTITAVSVDFVQFGNTGRNIAFGFENIFKPQEKYREQSLAE